MTKKASKEDIKVSLRSKWKNRGNICIPFVEIKAFEHLPMSFLAIHSVFCFRHFSGYKKTFLGNISTEMCFYRLPCESCVEKLRITWWATHSSLEKAIFSNYQNVRIILCIWMDKIFNTSSQRINTIPSQITFFLASHTQELDSEYSPGDSDLWLYTIKMALQEKAEEAN